MRRAALPALVAVLAIAACGGDDDDTASGTTEPTDISLATIPPPTTAATPEVDLPETAPEELATTVITEGSGHEAAEGDGVLVRYVGVSFETEEEFDSNFGGQPFPVVLGQTSVIEGWTEGLVGVRAGERLQLDIPAEMAYGPTPTATTTPASAATDVTNGTTQDTDDTGATDATDASTTTTVDAASGPPTGPLSFVIDVLAVVPPTDPADAPPADEIPTLCPRPVTETTTPGTSAATDGTADPTATTTAETTLTTTAETTATTIADGDRSPATTSDGTTAASTAESAEPAEAGCDVHVDEIVTDDLVTGDGPTASLGQTAILQFVLARADNGVVLRSSWDDGQPTQLPLVPGAEMTGMIEGIEGMQVGGRRAITVPFDKAFGPDGYPTVGLPRETDVVVVVDLLAVYT